MKYLLTTAVVFAFMLCGTLSQATAQYGEIVNPNNRAYYGDWYVSGWTANWPTSSNQYGNTNTPAYAKRIWNGDSGQLWYSWIYMHQYSDNPNNPDGGYVGLDYGIGRNTAPKQIFEINGDSTKLNEMLTFRFSDYLNPLSSNNGNDGFWYMGPKVIIDDESTYRGLEGYNFECYIIEKASYSPNQLMNRLNAGGQLISRGSSQHWDGQNMVTYNHYDRDFAGFKQVFAIRESWKDPGQTHTNVSTQVNWIQYHWSINNIVPMGHWNHGWKANIEFEGKFGSGDCGFAELQFFPVNE